jgi:hypothetical protein
VLLDIMIELAEINDSIELLINMIWLHLFYLKMTGDIINITMLKFKPFIYLF